MQYNTELKWIKKIDRWFTFRNYRKLLQSTILD